MKIYRRIIQEIDNLLYLFQISFVKIKPTVNLDVPFVCQFAHPDHAELSLKNELNPQDDKHWADTGAFSPDRYAEWAFTMCGMASTSMALAYYKDEYVKPVTLAEDALANNVYHEELDGSISNMKYREFRDWLGKYGLTARVISRLPIRGIQSALSNDKLVIISVNPNIREYDTASNKQIGGHLVVVTGYSREAKTMSINNPSGFVSTKTQVNHTIPVDVFKKYYAGRGIILTNNI